MPAPLRFAVVLWWVVALLLLLETAALWFGTQELTQQLMSAENLTGAQAEQRLNSMLLSQTAFGVVFAAAYLGFGTFVHRRRGGARIGLTVFGLLHLLMLLVTASVFTAQGILLIPGLVAGVLMWRASSSEWLTGER